MQSIKTAWQAPVEIPSISVLLWIKWVKHTDYKISRDKEVAGQVVAGQVMDKALIDAFDDQSEIEGDGSSERDFDHDDQNDNNNAAILSWPSDYSWFECVLF